MTRDIWMESKMRIRVVSKVLWYIIYTFVNNLYIYKH